MKISVEFLVEIPDETYEKVAEERIDNWVRFNVEGGMMEGDDPMKDIPFVPEGNTTYWEKDQLF